MEYFNQELILIGGAAASGKDTLIEAFRKVVPDVGYYRRINAFFDCASEWGIDIQAVYEKVSPDEANKRFVTECAKYRVMISDVHYAVQMKRDRDFLLRGKSGDINENYVPTISYELCAMLEKASIRTTAVLLYADAQTLFDRAVNRKMRGEKELRAVSLVDVERELRWERCYWEELLNNFGVRGLSWDTSRTSSEEIAICLKDLLI